MANEGKERAIAALGRATANARCTFKTSDLEELTGKYDTVTCVDVMIHYPSEKVGYGWMVGRLRWSNRDLVDRIGSAPGRK